MKYKIIVDSSCDLTKEMEKNMDISSIPFKINIDDKEFIDDENLNLNEFFEEMKKSSNPIKTSCPSPYDYEQVMEEFKDKDMFIITVSSKLSGSNNSANLAKNEFLRKYPNNNVYIIDSLTASGGETNIALKLYELIEKNLEFDEIVDEINKYTKELNTFFLLENLDNLIKSGRIKKTAGIIANILNIKPIMRGVNGEIELYEKNRGFKKGLVKLANDLPKISSDLEEKVLVITQANALDKAEFLKEQIEKTSKFKEILIIATKGLSSGYANEGGIVISF